MEAEEVWRILDRGNSNYLRNLKREQVSLEGDAETYRQIFYLLSEVAHTVRNEPGDNFHDSFIEIRPAATIPIFPDGFNQVRTNDKYVAPGPARPGHFQRSCTWRTPHTPGN